MRRMGLLMNTGLVPVINLGDAPPVVVFVGVLLL